MTKYRITIDFDTEMDKKRLEGRLEAVLSKAGKVDNLWVAPARDNKGRSTNASKRVAELFLRMQGGAHSVATISESTGQSTSNTQASLTKSVREGAVGYSKKPGSVGLYFILGDEG